MGTKIADKCKDQLSERRERRITLRITDESGFTAYEQKTISGPGETPRKSDVARQIKMFCVKEHQRRESNRKIRQRRQTIKKQRQAIAMLQQTRASYKQKRMSGPNKSGPVRAGPMRTKPMRQGLML